MTQTDPVVLHGYHLSVCNRIVRRGLQEKGVPYERVKVNPFEDPLRDGDLDLYPVRHAPHHSHADLPIDAPSLTVTIA